MIEPKTIGNEIDVSAFDRASGLLIRAAGDTRIWIATPSDYAFIMALCKVFREQEYFWVPDYAIAREIRRGNIVAFDYRVLEAGYLWVTFPRSGKCRINHLAVDAQLWRNKVGTAVTAWLEAEARRRGCWAVYLSCNSKTPGHRFWPEVGYSAVVTKKAGRRGGTNIVWAKLLEVDGFLIPPSLSQVKSVESYTLQYSLKPKDKQREDTQMEWGELWEVTA